MNALSAEQKLHAWTMAHSICTRSGNIAGMNRAQYEISRITSGLEEEQPPRYSGEELEIRCPSCGSYSFHEGKVSISSSREKITIAMHGSGCGHSFNLRIMSHGGMADISTAVEVDGL